MSELDPEGRVRIGRNSGASGGCYEVLFDGVKVGVIQKYRKTYNLRRFIVNEGWDLWLDGRDPDRGHRLRRHALEQARKVLLS